MMKRILSIAGSIFLMAVVMGSAGCGCNRYAVAERDGLPVSVSSGDDIEILWADSHRVDSTLMIHGTMKRKLPGSTPLKAHIDVQLFSMEDELLQEACTRDVYLPRNLPGKGMGFERFELEFENISAENTKILLSPHQGEHDENL
jgi:hypothetical protein